MELNTNTWNRIRYTVYRPFYDLIAVYFKSFRKQSIYSLQLEPKDKVLIIGAGTGLDLEFLTQQKSITAIDITPAMISELVNRAESMNMNIDAHVMDGSQLDFTDESFDAVILHLIVAVIPDPIGCLKETERVLKPGGKFTIIDKFIPSGSKPGILRRALNPIANLIATNLNRDIDALLSHTNLKKESDDKLRSIFRLITGSKTHENYQSNK
ncbi:MAG: methyltransferase domain-containing protein [Balneolaceae bacterium]|nr:methyltransferase domain-containing protein [Balneolaceae bacterium]MBO6547515.1 methyltransferase domain-containing protein [Balneolaceae bacterium]MBO6647538.1 methyltransferase domain-containing protein [Balneolaceae bacterium]